MDIIEALKGLFSIIFSWPAAAIIGVIVVALILKRGGIKSLSITKDGLVAETRVPAARVSQEYHMNKRIGEVDNEIYAEAKESVRLFGKAIRRPLRRIGLCEPSLRSIAFEMREPLIHAIDENNLKVHLSQEERESYIQDKIQAIKAEYEDITNCNHLETCNSAAKYPDWTEIGEEITQAVRTWAHTVARIVITGCQKKIEIYEEYRPTFVEAKDDPFVGIVDDCITKNKGYIEKLL